MNRQGSVPTGRVGVCGLFSKRATLQVPLLVSTIASTVKRSVSVCREGAEGKGPATGPRPPPTSSQKPARAGESGTHADLSLRPALHEHLQSQLHIRCYHHLVNRACAQLSRQRQYLLGLKPKPGQKMQNTPNAGHPRVTRVTPPAAYPIMIKLRQLRPRPNHDGYDGCQVDCPESVIRGAASKLS